MILEKQIPASLISLLIHIIVILILALIVISNQESIKDQIIILSADSEVNEISYEPDELNFPEQEIIENEVNEIPQESFKQEDFVLNNDISQINEPLNNTIEPNNILGDIQLGEINDKINNKISQGYNKGILNRRKDHGKLVVANGGDKNTENAVDLALKYIINHQMADGGWSFNLNCNNSCSHTKNLDDRCAATSLALLPFLGRGYTHKSGPYKKQIEAGLNYLTELSINGQGKCYNGAGNLYSQGLAGIALSEAYAMTMDNRLQAPAQMSLYFIEQSQDPIGGGWRYNPKQPGDTSAFGWQIMALKSGHMAYLNVNIETIKNASRFLDSVEEDSGAYYGYTSPGRGVATTSVGLLCRMYMGWKKDHPSLQRGVDFLSKKGFSSDLYSNYYTTQIMHHMGGEVWTNWNNNMKNILLKNQVVVGHEAGSWFKGVDGGHGAHSAGRLYCTSLATMMLEVYYRHLPLYGNNIEEEFIE